MATHPLVRRFIGVKKRRPGMSYNEFGRYFNLTGSMVRQIEQEKTGLGRNTLGVILVRYPSWTPLIVDYVAAAGRRVLGLEPDEASAERLDASIGDGEVELS